jgi:hypothetical protein
MRWISLAAALLVTGIGASWAAEVQSPEPVPALTPAEVNDGFVSLFDGKTMEGWQGDVRGYVPQNGLMICKPGGNVFTKKEYGDFIFRFEFKLTPNANNGVGIRTPTNVNPAYGGMEIQVLDDSGSHYKTLQPYQYHGSIYGVVPCKRGHQQPVGQWNTQEIYAKGSHVKVTLNGVVIVDADLSKIDENKTEDHQKHFGLHNKKGYIGFLGHGSYVEFRNLRVKEL